MKNLTLAAETIKENVSALDVGEAVGLEIRRGRCRCPFHGGTDYNCVLYRGDRGFYCHVCKAGGDVIQFVREYYKMSFPDAARWLNNTFRLGMDIDSPMDQNAVKQAENARKTRVEEKERQEWKERTQFELFLAVDRILEMLEEQRDRNVPKTPWERWDPQFCEAVRLIPEVRRFAEDCMMKCMKEEKRWMNCTNT